MGHLNCSPELALRNSVLAKGEQFRVCEELVAWRMPLPAALFGAE